MDETFKIRNIVLISSPKNMDPSEYYRFAVAIHQVQSDRIVFDNVIRGLGLEIVDGVWAGHPPT